MLTYSVIIDGEWQVDFDDFGSAHNWAHAVGETGRTAYLTVKRGRLNLVAVFPERHAKAGTSLWMRRPQSFVDDAAPIV